MEHITDAVLLKDQQDMDSTLGACYQSYVDFQLVPFTDKDAKTKALKTHNVEKMRLQHILDQYYYHNMLRDMQNGKIPHDEEILEHLVKPSSASSIEKKSVEIKLVCKKPTAAATATKKRPRSSSPTTITATKEFGVEQCCGNVVMVRPCPLERDERNPSARKFTWKKKRWELCDVCRKDAIKSRNALQKGK